VVGVTGVVGLVVALVTRVVPGLTVVPAGVVVGAAVGPESPPGRVAEAVEVATDLLWAILLGMPAMRAGPGTG